MPPTSACLGDNKMMDIVSLSICCIPQPNSRTERPRKPKIGTNLFSSQMVKVTRLINAVTDNAQYASQFYNFVKFSLLLMSGKRIVPFDMHLPMTSRRQQLQWRRQSLPCQIRSSPKRFTKSWWRLALTCCCVIRTSTALACLKGSPICIQTVHLS